MTRRVRPWVPAVLVIAATRLMATLAVTVTTGVNHSHTHIPAADSNGVTS
jgi:hypothetical protein